MNITNKPYAKIYKDLGCTVTTYENPMEIILEIIDWTSNHFYRIVLKAGKVRTFCKPGVKFKYRNIENRMVCPLTRKRVNEIMDGLGIS